MDLLKIWEIIERQWEKKSTIIFVILLLFFGLPWLFLLIDFSKLQIWQLVFIFSIILGTFVFWLYSTKCPRCKKGKRGILIAIIPEDKDDENAIDSDFVSMMRHESCVDNNLQIISLPCRFSKKIIDSDKAVFFCRKAKTSMIIWGSVKKRKAADTENRILRLHTTIVHPPIPKELSAILGKSMSEIMPLNLNIDSKNESFVFEVTAKWMNWTVKYLIANVMLFERDMILAEKYMLDLYYSKEISETNIPQLRKLYQLVRESLIGIYEIKARLAYLDWQKNKKPQCIKAIGDNLSKISDFGSQSYGYRLLRAIYFFLDGRNVDAAIKEILLCKKITNDVTWIYSLAFLHAYKGNLAYAQRFYKQAFNGLIDPSQILHIETFILDVIEKEHDKVQLFFCLGLICYHMKMDNICAKKYLVKFLEMPGVEIKYHKQVDETKRILDEIAMAEK